MPSTGITFGSYKLSINKDEWQRIILTELSRAISKAVVRAAHSATPLAKKIFKDAITTSDVWNSLEKGALAGQLGLEVFYGKYRLEAVLEKWLEFVRIEPSVSSVQGGRKLVGSPERYPGFKLYILDLSFQNVLAVPESQIKSKGGIVKWLDWLLTKGDSIIVKNYHIIPARTDSQILASRSWLNLMAKGGEWGLPSSLAGTGKITGTKQDNFVTRAIDGVETDFIKLLLSELFRHME